MATSDELEWELARIRAELRQVQEELDREVQKRCRLEGEIEGFRKCFNLINSFPDPDAPDNEDELN